MDSSGSMPENLSKEKFVFYMNLSKELRKSKLLQGFLII